MSYDLLVFEPSDEMRDPARFLDWYDATEDAGEDLDPYDMSNAGSNLAVWLAEMTRTFVPMNGPEAPDFESEEPEFYGDYAVMGDHVYVSFSWSFAEHAHNETVRCAGVANVGFFDVSSEDGAVWFPDGKGQLVHAFNLSDYDPGE